MIDTLEMAQITARMDVHDSTTSASRMYAGLAPAADSTGVVHMGRKLPVDAEDEYRVDSLQSSSFNC